MFRITPYRYGLREISPEWPESPIGVDRAVAVDAEHGEFSAGRACGTPEYGAGRTFHADKPSAISLRTIGYAHHADYGPAGANGITTRSKCESICRGGYAKDPTTSATIVRTVIA